MTERSRGAAEDAVGRARPHGRGGSATLAERRALYRRTPRVVTWEVTRSCPLACAHCRAEAERARHPNELDTDEGRRLVDQVAEFGPPPPVLVFSGGDPLRRPDLLELIRHARSRNLPVAVIPAPTSEVDRATVRSLEEAGTRRMALSLDGASAEAHDAFRGEPGSHDAALEAAAHAREVGLPLQVNTTVTASTRGELPAIADRVEELGAVAWEVFFLVPVGRGRALDAPTPDAHERIMAWLYRRQRQAPFRVLTVEGPFYRRIASQIELEESGSSVVEGSTSDGNGFVFVSHTGEVCPSGFLPLARGDVRERSLVQIYRDDPLFRKLREPDGFGGKCGGCEYRRLCGGSRARAWALTGDPLDSDPFCPYVPPSYEERVDREEAPPPEEYFERRRRDGDARRDDGSHGD